MMSVEILRTPMSVRTTLRAVALVVMVGVFLRADYNMTTNIVRWQPLGIDFLAIWAGIRTGLDHPALLYDFSAVTHAQHFLLGAISQTRPFVYPPSAALVLLPFGLMGYWPAYISFMLLSGGLFLHAAWRVSRRALPLALLVTMPPVVLVVLAGQVSFLIGGLVLSALLAKDRPILAGLLWGVAAAVKPQLLVLFPLALLLEQRWRTLVVALLTGACLCGASALVFGFAAWMDWFGALPRFSRLIVENRGLLRIVITPMAVLERAGVGGPALIGAQFLCVCAGAAIVWRTFTRDTCTAERLTALIGGGLLLTPYAIGYELALLAPAVGALTGRIEGPRRAAYYPALPLMSMLIPGWVALLGLLACILWPWRRIEANSPPVAVNATA